MRFHEHLALGFAANAAAFWLLYVSGWFNPALLQNTALALTAVFSIALFSILPDVDSINSFASKILRLLLLVIALSSIIEFVSTQSLFPLAKAFAALLVFTGHFLYAKRGKMHRQFPHSLLFGAAACAALYLLTSSKSIALSAAIAFLSHLLADWHLANAFKQDFRRLKKLF